MSQMPPPPGSYPQTPPPPPGYPAVPPPPGMMGGMPQGYGMIPPPRQSNGFAVASLVSGLVFCVPVVSQLLAILFGLIGLKAAGKAGGRGRVLSVLGILLGLLFLGGYVVAGAGVSKLYHRADPHRAMVTRFVQDLAAGNTAGAKAVCTADVTDATLNHAVSVLTSQGKLNNVVVAIAIDGDNADDVGIVTSLMFANGGKSMVISLTKLPDGTWAIKDWTIN